MRNALQAPHYSIRTENAYVDWARRFTLRVFRLKRRPKDMGNPETAAFLTYLADTVSETASVEIGICHKKPPAGSRPTGGYSLLITGD